MRFSGKQTKRAISLVLCLTLLVSMMAFVLTVRAEETDTIAETGADVASYDGTNSKDLADTGAAGDYIYCKNSAGWSTVTAYMWVKDTQTNNAAWPGAAMTKVSGDIWRYQVPSNNLNMIIFSNNGGSQTSDMTYPGAGYMYDNNTKQWSMYAPPSTTVNPTQGGGTNPTTAPQPTQASGEKTYVYCDNEAGWSNVTVYMWNSTSDTNAGWPGVAMTHIGGSEWRYEVPKSYAKVIFSNNGSDQTSDLTFPGNNYMWNNKTKTWSIRDTSPLQVTSFSTDVESPQYNGVGVMLSAAAEGQGTVYYKFSVTNPSGGTSVLQNFSTSNSVQWIPQTVGTYTLTYDFKDAAGNTNKRTKSYVIEDGLNSVAPYIKTVTPNKGEIQNNKAVNMTVTAGGGITGTNLLFYKFTVKNSSGTIVNTPYYTLSGNYTFTPTSLGAYSVTVDVQGSDNKTVERTYDFTSVGSVTPTDPPSTEPPVQPTQPPTQPATQAPTQAPTQKPTQPPVPVLLGDADDDGDVGIIDVTYVQRYEAGLALPTPLNPKNADVDGDEEISIIDATLIQRFLVGIIHKFPAEA